VGRPAVEACRGAGGREIRVTPRECILAALDHRVPARTPSFGWFHPEVRQTLLAYYKSESWDEVLAQLGIEGWVEKAPRLPGRRAIWLDDRAYKDGWGVEYRIGERGWYEEWVGGPLVSAETIADVESCVLPGSDQIREPEDYPAEVSELKGRGLFVTAEIDNPYKRAWLLRGMENVLADYLINRDMLEALYGRLYHLYGEMVMRMARAGVDMIEVVGDIAMEDRIIMGPEAWRAVDKPRLARLVADAHSINPDVHFFIHSDGDVTALMDDLIEIGFEVINPVQPECMNPVEVKRRWGDKITIHGGISLRTALPNGTPDEVRAEVEHLIRKCGYNGGLVVFPSNVIQPGTPVENIIACFHTARDFDVSALGGRPG